MKKVFLLGLLLVFSVTLLSGCIDFGDDEQDSYKVDTVSSSDEYSSSTSEAESYAEETEEEKEYAWVLIETVPLTRAEQIALSNENFVGIYVKESNYSEGCVLERETYVGETDTYYDDDKLNGETLATKFQWSEPPEIIRKDQVVSMDISLEATDVMMSFFAFSAGMGVVFDSESVGRNGGATAGKITFKNSDGKEYFTLTKDAGYAPVEQTVYATPRTAYEEGARMALIVYGGMFHVQTGYIYEWTEI